MDENQLNDASPKTKRKTVIIKKMLQLKFTMVVFFAVFFAVMLVGVDVYITINKYMIDVFSVNPDFVHALTGANNFLMLQLVLYIILVMLVSFFISHKIAGPMYRFERSCEEIGAGNLTYRVNLRKTDELLDFQDKFNLMIDNLQSKLQQLDQVAGGLEKSGESQQIKQIRSELNKQFKIN